MSRTLPREIGWPGAVALAAAAERLGLRLVVRFGSRASGAVPPPTPESDLDIAVLAGAGQRVSVFALCEALSPVFGDADLDVALLDDADPLFRYEVFRRCDLLYGDSDLYAEYQCYAYRDFMDSADLREIEDVLSRRKLQRLLDATA